MISGPNQKLPEGILLVDKPKGITSFGVIRQLRKKLGVKKMGHAGTLDPNATGLMIIAIGNATKKLTDYLKLPKTYEAEILFGVRTDTGDTDGTIVEKREGEVSEVDVRRVLSEMVGTLELPVPAYSAIKQGGEPLYKKARRGEKVETPIKTMVVEAADFIAQNTSSQIRVRFGVGSGTYIRSLAEELARRLGTIATLSNLRRTRIGEYHIESAMTL